MKLLVAPMSLPVDPMSLPVDPMSKVPFYCPSACTVILVEADILWNGEVTNHNDKYSAYRILGDLRLQGLKHSTHTGAELWSNLKLSSWLSKYIQIEHHRNRLMADLLAVTRTYPEPTFTTRSLLDGYNQTDVYSCMCGLGHYYQNFEDSGKLLESPEGRAILWDDQDIIGLPDGCNGLVDRVYPSSNHKVVSQFIAYASKRNLLVKARQTFEARDEFIWHGEEVCLQLTLVPRHAKATNLVPYMDTFAFTDDFQTFNNTGGEQVLNSEFGAADGYCHCCECGALVLQDDAFRDDDEDDYCKKCFHAATCDHCDRMVRSASLSESTQGQICEYCVNDFFIFCVDTQRYSEDVYYAEDIREYYENVEELHYVESLDQYFRMPEA